MSFFAIIARVVLSTLAQPAVQDIFSSVGRYALRQATAGVVRAVRNQTRLRKGIKTVH